MRAITSRRGARFVCGLAVLLLPDGFATAQQSPSSLDHILAGWQKRRERVGCIRYTVVGEGIVPKGSRTDDLGRALPDEPPRDIVQKQNVAFLLDLRRQRFRMELDETVYHSQKRQLMPRASTVVFDGRDLATALPRERNTSPVHTPAPLDPDLMLSRGYAKCYPLKVVVSRYQAPLLFAHGFVPRYVSAPDFGGAPDPDDFIVSGQIVHGRRPCTVVKTFPLRNYTNTSWDEYWVDEARDFVVVRQLAYQNGKPVIDLDIAYQQSSHGWLPERWTGTTRINGVVVNVTRQRVQEFVIDPTATDADYQIEARPGMVILEDDFNDPGKEQFGPGFRRKLFRVAADGSWQEIINGVEQPAEGPCSWLRRHWVGLTLALLAALLAVAGWYWLARPRRGQPPGQAAAPPA